MPKSDQTDISFQQVQQFWEKNPLCAWEIPHPIGSKEYFSAFDALRERIEPASFASSLHQYGMFRNKKVLEVGCGNGHVLHQYAAAGALVSGLDATQAGMDLTKERFKLYGLKGDFVLGSAEDLPFEDNAFDCVCSMGVLHHVPNTKRAVSEIFRVLKPGGRLVVMLYHRNSVLYRLKFPILSLLSRKSRKQLVNEVDGLGNPKGDVYSKKEMLALLRDFGDVETFVRLIEGWMVIPKLGKYIPSSIFKPLENWFGWFLYAKAYKPR